MSIYLKEQTLPGSVHAAFAAIKDREVRDGYVAALRAREWTLSSIAEAAQVSRERVRQIAAETEPRNVQGWPLPEPPLKPQPAARKQYAAPDPAKLKRLLELQPLARKVTGNSESNREAGEDYTALIWEIHHDDGVPLYRLAKFLPSQSSTGETTTVTAGALRSRLARYGYLVPPKGGKSKSYNRINPDNRVAV